MDSRAVYIVYSLDDGFPHFKIFEAAQANFYIFRLRLIYEQKFIGVKCHDVDVLGGEEMTTRARIWPLADLSTLYTKVLGFDLMKRRKYSYRHIIGQQQPPARNRQSSRCVSYITHTARQYLIYKPQARWWWWGPGERARAHWATCNIRFLLLLHHLLTAEDDRKLYLQKTIFFLLLLLPNLKKGSHTRCEVADDGQVKRILERQLVGITISS